MDLTHRYHFHHAICNNRTLRHFLMCLKVQVQHLVRQKNQPMWLLLLRSATENPRSILPEQVSESAEIWIRDPIGVPRCSPQSGTPYITITSFQSLRTKPMTFMRYHCFPGTVVLQLHSSVLKFIFGNIDTGQDFITVMSIGKGERFLGSCNTNNLVFSRRGNHNRLRCLMVSVPSRP
jgi:hypothetical protein